MSQLSKQRKFLSLEEKPRVITLPRAGKQKSTIAEEFEIPVSSLSTMLKSKDTIAKKLASGTSEKHKKLSQPVLEALYKAGYPHFGGNLRAG